MQVPQVLSDVRAAVAIEGDSFSEKWRPAILLVAWCIATLLLMVGVVPVSEVALLMWGILAAAAGVDIKRNMPVR